MYDIPTQPTVITITPEMAADWLENRNLQKNRRLSEHIAGKYARDMREGRWMLTHQGIAFDADEFLIDGQHRLRAIVLADQPIDMFVVPDCARDTFAVLDNGYKRQAAHVIDAPYAKTIASAAKFLVVVADDTRRAAGPVYDSGLTTAETVAIVDAWPELKALSGLIETCYAATKITRPAHLAVIAQAARTRHAEQIEGWFDGLRSGAGLESTDPRLGLRNRWLRDHKFLNGASGRPAAYRLIARSWNAWAEGRPLAKAQVWEDRPAPEITR